MINYVKGNLLDLAEQGQFDLVVHGCNCFNTMGGGIAKQIAKRWPEAQLVDSATARGDYNKLGNFTLAQIIRPNAWFTVINAYTQFNMSSTEDVFEYTAFELILQKLLYQDPGARYGLPLIGMGLAGGDPGRIIPMIERFADKVIADKGSVTIVEYQP